MNKQDLAVFVFFTVVTSSLAIGDTPVAAQPGAEQTGAKDSITVLGKTWQFGYTAKDEQQQIMEYVLPGEVVEKWSALVSRVFIHDPEARYNIKKVLNIQRSLFPPDCINFTWTVIRQTKTEVLYTWQHDSCDQSPAEAERAFMRRVPGGLCRWSYATRVDPLNTKNLEQLDADLANLPCDQPN